MKILIFLILFLLGCGNAPEVIQEHKIPTFKPTPSEESLFVQDMSKPKTIDGRTKKLKGLLFIFLYVTQTHWEKVTAALEEDNIQAAVNNLAICITGLNRSLVLAQELEMDKEFISELEKRITEYRKRKDYLEGVLQGDY